MDTNISTLNPNLNLWKSNHYSTMNKQEAVIKYIEDNYLQFSRLRHDVISDKLQIRLSGEEAMRLLGERQEYWREMTKNDINSIVCHCAQECDVNITSREVMTALQSDLIPDVHPLREYILSLPPYTPDQPDWIDFVASQVKVRESAQDRPAGCRSAQVPVDGRSAAPVVFHNESTASGEGDTYKNDNLDNLRPNQYPLGALGEDKNQQLKQLDPTTFRSPTTQRAARETILHQTALEGCQNALRAVRPLRC